MSRRPSLPGAAELFRSTGGSDESPSPAVPAQPTPSGKSGQSAPVDGRRPVERLARLGVPREEAPDRGAGDRGAGDRGPGDRGPGDRAAGERSASVTPLTGAATADGLADLVERAPAEPPLHGLRAPAPAFDDEDSGGQPVRRPAARIRQTRRQPTRGAAERRPSGRERHDEKITVYCSAEELFELERARLALRGDHGLVVDRGRIVREAVAVVLADLDAKGDSSILVRRLRES